MEQNCTKCDLGITANVQLTASQKSFEQASCLVVITETKEVKAARYKSNDHFKESTTTDTR